MDSSGIQAITVVATGATDPVAAPVMEVDSLPVLRAFVLTAGAGDVSPHQISADYLPTAWKSVGLNPEDYAHLDPVLANKIIAIAVKFADPA